MNDFTVLMQIERQMQEQFHTAPEQQPAVARRQRAYHTLRLQLSRSLRRLASAIEPVQPTPNPTPRHQAAR